jgi:formamidopyrimidine-DNA glycosylase
MFELPEVLILSRQMNEVLPGKTVREGCLGNTPHTFVWYNRSHEEFGELTAGKAVGEAWAKGKWLFLSLDPGYVLLLGEWGGSVLYRTAGSPAPEKHHLLLRFRDDSFLTATTRMWGAAELHKRGEEHESKYIKNMKMTPTDEQFTLPYFLSLVQDLGEEKRVSAKGLLTQNQVIPGLGNAIAQDILYRARIHPRRPVGEMDRRRLEAFYHAIMDTVSDVIAGGGRSEETDLFGRSGGYARVMDKNALRRPCPGCGGPISKMQYLGGSCYFCPRCQA